MAIVIALISAALHYFAMPPSGLPEGIYAFLLPFIFWSYSKPRWRVFLLSIFCSGWISWCFILFWLRHVTVVGMLSLSLVMALFWVAWGALLRYLIPPVVDAPFPKRLVAMGGCAAFWVVLEWLRGQVFTGFPWLPLAATQWERPAMLQVMEWTGSGGVSFVLVFFNLGLSYFLYHLGKRRKKGKGRGSIRDRFCPDLYLSLGMLLLMFVIFLMTLGSQKKQTPMFNAALIQPYAPVFGVNEGKAVELSWQYLEDEMADAVSYEGLELVVWPESSLATIAALGNPGGQQFAERLVRDANLPVLGGALAQLDGKWYNASMRISPSNGVSSTFYAKRHLVPFGEYVPLEGWLPFLRKVVPYEGEFSVGEKATVLPVSGMGKTWWAGSLICYEDAYAGLARENVRNEADFHLVITNNAWFGEEGGAYQHAAHSVLRAIETRRPVVRCGNAGWSGWIDAYGNIRKVITDESGSIYFRGWGVVKPESPVMWRGKHSFYVKAGEWFTVICLLMVIFATAIPLLRQRN